MPEINRSISFDAGIEQVLNYVEAHPAQLPEADFYDRGEGIYRQQLDEVLFPPSVEQSLVESFRPSVSHRRLLTPTGYHAAHAECKQELSAALEKLGDRPDGAKLKAMADLLADGEQLTNLLYTYRHLLHKA